MKQKSRRCHKCTQPYDFVDFSSFVFSVSSFLRCRYCGFHNRVRPKNSTWGRKALFAFIFILMVFLVIFSVRYFFAEPIKDAPIFSDREAYLKTEHYQIWSLVYESKISHILAGAFFLLIVGLPAFILTCMSLNVLYYFRSWK